MATDDGSETTDEMVARLVQERLDAKEAETAKADKLKKLGLTQDVVDVIADAVWDRGEARAAARKKADEDADQEPTTTKKPRRNFLGMIPTGTDDD